MSQRSRQTRMLDGTPSDDMIRFLENCMSLSVLIVALAVGVEPANHLGLAVNGSFQSARKHAFPDGPDGMVTISASESGDALPVTVCDNGVGIDDAAQSHDSESIGIEIVQGHSF